MREVFAEAFSIMDRRKSVFWQLLAIFPALIVVVIIAVIFGALTRSVGAGILVGILLAVFAMLFVLGAAYGALGEATANRPPSPYFLRGWRLIGRSAAFLGSAIVAEIALTLVSGALFGAFFGSSMLHKAQLLQSMGTPGPQAMSVLFGMMLPLGIVFVVVSLAVFPLLYGLAAGLFAGGLKYADAFYSAGQEYVQGRFLQWVAVWAAYFVGTAILEGLYFYSFMLTLRPSAVGFAGLLELIFAVISMLFGWYMSALAFALWQSHQPKDPGQSFGPVPQS